MEIAELQTPAEHGQSEGNETLTARQQEVLSAVLDLMVETGDGFSMNAVAARANCSKETLYKWFGDREGLLNATVQWQAAKVRFDAPSQSDLTLESLQVALEQFAQNWLAVISGEISIALNRLAVSHAGSNKSELGKIVLKNGPFAMGARIKPVLEAAQDADILAFDNVDYAFRTFFGLVVRDVQIRSLLGDGVRSELINPKRDGAEAVKQFLALYGKNLGATKNPKHKT